MIDSPYNARMIDKLYLAKPRGYCAGVVMAIEAVESIHEHVPVRPHAEETTSTMQTGSWNGGATPYHDAGILGAGQVLMVPSCGMNGFGSSTG